MDDLGLNHLFQNSRDELGRTAEFMTEEKELGSLRKQLAAMLSGREAHLDFASAVADFPFELAGAKPGGAPHSAWELIEHLRIAQRDILDFSRPGDYQERKWPDEYWPSSAAPSSREQWNRSLMSFGQDLRALQELAQDSSNDLFTPLPHGTGQTLLREVLLVADHNSHHLGQLLFVKKMLAR